MSVNSRNRWPNWPEYADRFRKIEYWGKLSLYIDDYSFESGDVAFLKLAYPKDDQPFSPKIPSKALRLHFEKEVKRLFSKVDLPVHDTFKGHGERFDDWLMKQYSSGNRTINTGKFEALEEARRNALTGMSNPGAIYCNIKVKRRDFPILYEIRAYIYSHCKGLFIAKKTTMFEVESKDLGYSTPEYIEGELKKAITEQLKEVSKNMEEISPTT